MTTMIGTLTINAAFLQDIKQDNRHLHDLLTSLRSLARHPASLLGHRRRFVELLAALCDQLALHFTLEEDFGYFDNALDVAPHLAGRAEALQCEHVELFDLARDLADAAAQAEARHQLTVQLPEILRRFQEFDLALCHHERIENDLIVAALQDDLGGGD